MEVRRWFRILFSAGITLSFPRFAPAAPGETKTIKLDFNGVSLTIDTESGNLLRLESPATGAILESVPGHAGLLDVAYPIEPFVALRLGTGYSKASITQRGEGGVTIGLDPLGPSRTSFKMPEGKVRAEITIRPAPDQHSVILKARIFNESKALIPQVLFPDLHGLKPIAGAATTQLRFGGNYPSYPFTEDPIPPLSAQYYVNSGWKEYAPSVGYYGVNDMRWLDFGGYSGGLSVHERAWGDPVRPTVRTHRSQSDPASLRLMWDHRIRIEPGQTWESAEFWLTPHPGGWARGIEPFRSYAREHIPARPALPETVKEGVGFQTIWLIQAPEKDPKYVNFRFTDIPRVAAEAQQHGIREIVLWGWCTYFEVPFKAREECGTADELVAAVKKCSEMGVKVLPFVSCYLNQNKLAQRFGAQPGAPAWVYHPDMVPIMDPYYMGAGYPVQFWSVFSVDPHNQNYHTDLKAAFKEWIDRGITSWSWDQVFADKPGTGGLTDLLFEVRSLARRRDPESTFSGEQVTNLEWDNSLLDYTWNWVDYVDCAPTTNVFRTPRWNCNIEDSPRIVKAGAIDNMMLNVMPRKPDQPNGTALISEKPELAKALKEMAAIRKQFLPYFTEGTFIGDAVMAEPSPFFIRGYQLAGKAGKGFDDFAHLDHLLIFVMNNQPQAMPVTFKTRLDWWLPATTTYTLQSFDAAGHLKESWIHSDKTLTLTTPTLQPLEIAVYDIEAEVQK